MLVDKLRMKVLNITNSDSHNNYLNTPKSSGAFLTTQINTTLWQTMICWAIVQIIRFILATETQYKRIIDQLQNNITFGSVNRIHFLISIKKTDLLK